MIEYCSPVPIICPEYLTKIIPGKGQGPNFIVFPSQSLLHPHAMYNYAPQSPAPFYYLGTREYAIALFEHSIDK